MWIVAHVMNGWYICRVKIGSITLRQDWIAVGIALMVLVGFSYQYPASMSTPVGGDAAHHIQQAKHWNTGQAYPLSMAMLAATGHITPASWETSFMLWAAFGHIAAGIIIGLVIYRLYGLMPAAIGIALWGSTTMDVLPFFRAATIPQLWSMPFLLLSIERLLNRSVGWALFLLVVTYYVHPLSFAIGAIITALALPSIVGWQLPEWLPRRSIAIAATFLAGTVALLSFLIVPHLFPYADLVWEEPWHNMVRLLSTHFGPAMILAPFGAAAIAFSSRISPSSRVTILAFGLISILLAASDMFGGVIPVKRLIPYGVAATAIFGAVGIYTLLRSFPGAVYIQKTIAVLLVLFILGNGWFTAQSAYNEFESGCISPYTCPTVLHAEREAYEWMRDHLPSHAVIAVEEGRGRATEWIPVIAERRMIAPHVSGQWVHGIFEGSCAEIVTLMTMEFPVPTHAIIYTAKEMIPTAYLEHAELFPIIYSNNRVLLFELPEPRAPQNEHDPLAVCFL